MTGKGAAQFLWWAIYAVTFYVILFRIFHIQVVVILWMFALSIGYAIGAAIIKGAK